MRQERGRIAFGEPTPSADVNAVLHALRSRVQALLGRRFVGMYLYGSLASGDFDPARSDNDFLVVTDGELPAETVAALEALHAQLADSGQKWAFKLEGSYVPQGALRRYDPDAGPSPEINEGRFLMARHGVDWVIQRHILREHGVAVAGPPPRDLIDPVQPDEIRQAARGTLCEWWHPMLDDPTRLQTSEYQAFAVVTMCRALHALRHGTIVFKPVAERWARAAVGERWGSLIADALAWRPDQPFDRVDEALEFIRYALEQNQQAGASASGQHGASALDTEGLKSYQG